VDDLRLHPEILEAAAEIASFSEDGGLPAPVLARLVAAVVHADRVLINDRDVSVHLDDRKEKNMGLSR
jgi:hypothetical protein